MPLATVRDKRSAICGTMLSVCLAMSALAGCQSGRYHTVASLPAQLRAPPVYNVQTVDLSPFAGPPVISELIAPGDVLTVSFAASLAAEDATEFSVRVGEDGSAMIPEIGPLRLAGLRLMEAEQQITQACVQGGLYRHPQVTVSMLRQRANRVTVVGGVEEPGVYELPRESSYVLSAITAAGGLSEDAGVKVEIRQPNGPGVLAGQWPDGAAPPGVRWAGHTAAAPGRAARLVCLNLAGSDVPTPQDTYLQDGAVVRVEKRLPEKIEVVGLVKTPGRYDYPVGHELRLFSAIAEAGGLSTKAADKVLVLRKDPHGEGSVAIQVRLSSAKTNAEENLRLAPGDIVSVEQTPATRLMDALNILRFGLGATMPIF